MRHGLVFLMWSVSHLDLPISNRGLAVARDFECSIEDFLQQTVIEGLICFEFVDLQEILEGANISNDGYFETECGVVAKLTSKGLVRLRGNQRVEITPEGRPLTT